jgi:autotransporter-associated beta strand protein
MTVNGSGAQVNVSGQLILGANGGKGAYTQAAGQTTVAGSVILGEGDYGDNPANAFGDPTQTPPLLPSHGDAVLNLNGGTLTAPKLTTRSLVVSSPSNSDGGAIRDLATHGMVNFNGGVLQASASSSDFIATDDPVTNPPGTNAGLATVTLNVMAGGAKIDIPASLSDTITQKLQHDPADGAPVTDGGLTKLGGGKLTLTGPLTYTGNTDVTGTLQIDTASVPVILSTISGATGTLGVGPGTTLTATSIHVDTLIIGTEAPGAALAAVPEPGTLVLLMLAGLTLAGACLRRG